MNDTRTQLTLIEQASMEVADVARAQRDLAAITLDAIRDGQITKCEEARIIEALRTVEKEVKEAALVSREAAYVKKENDFRDKRGRWAEPHYYLRREREEIRAMGGLRGYPDDPKPPPTPAGAVLRFRARPKTRPEPLDKSGTGRKARHEVNR